MRLGLVPDAKAYESQYYTYMMNGLMTQLVRIKPGHQIEEAHMRNRALIAHWCMEHGKMWWNSLNEMARHTSKSTITQH